MRPSFVVQVLGIGAAVCGLVACSSSTQPVSRQAEPAAGAVPSRSGAPSLAELRNATYGGFSEPTGPVTLADGRWEGAPYDEGGASRPAVSFAGDLRLAGDLDGDGAEEAVVLLAQSSGGSGEYIYLAVVGRKDGGPHNVATVLVGDRVDVRGARLEGRRVLLDVVQAGPGDAMCCPGDLATRSWELRAGALTELAPVRTGRLSLDAIGGIDWVLRKWAWQEAAPAEPSVVLRFEGGRFTGRSGCNSYVAPAKAGETPGDVTVGPSAGTRMACPEPAMAIETRFLRQLGGVTSYSFLMGQLALTYQDGERTGVMLFDRAAVR